MSTDRKRGRFVWYDLMTTDLDGAVDFYGAVAGWTTQPFDAGGEPYTMWVAGDAPIGGVVRIDPETMGDVSPNWMAHISSPDIDETVETIRELGGRIYHGPENIPNVGRFAIAADPQGAVFAVFTGEEEPPGSDAAPRPGEFSWNELSTTDYESAFDFYSRLFGWKVTNDMDMGEAGTYRIYGLNGRDLGGIYNRPPGAPGGPMWLFYVSTADLDAAVRTVEERGGRVLVGPMEVPGGDRIVQCTDPQGAMFALHGK